MAKYMVTAKRLNKRKFPVNDFSDKSNIAGVVENGFTFEGTEATDLANALGKWLKDRDGYYYWGGGVIVQDKSELDSTNQIKETRWKFLSGKMSWVHDSVENGGLGIVDLWNMMGVRGEGVNVLVLDTGIIESKDFIRNGASIIQGQRFSNGLFSINDFDGHGTKSASIIGATGNNLIFGIAPNVNLFIIKIAANQYLSEDDFLQGLKLIEEQWPIDIISISYCFGSNNKSIENFFHSIKENQIVLSALNHNALKGFSINNNQFPAFYDDIIPIAATKQKTNEIVSPCEFISGTNKTIWGFPGENIMTLNLKGSICYAQQTSIATPLGSAVFSLFISYLKKKNISVNKRSISILKDLLIKTANKIKTPINDQTEIESIEVFSIQPIEAFNQFINFFK
jgi:hypothetical protein